MKNKFVKERLEGLTRDVHNWELVKTSSLFKPESRKADVEITASYFNAARTLYKAVKQESHPDKGLSVMRMNSLIIPFLFLCRHSVELGIKATLNNKKIKYSNIHNLRELFSKLNIEVDETYLDLMDTLDLIDDKGMWLRYDKDLKNKTEYLSSPYFVNSKEIINTTEKFLNFLIEEQQNYDE